MLNKKKSSKKVILLIDDDSYFVRAACIHLKRCGFKNIHSATNGIEGISLTEELNPEIVLLDVELPEINGFEVLQQFHRQKLDPKVILMTGHDSGEVGMLGARLGVTDFIAKHQFWNSVEIKILEAIALGKKISETGGSPRNIIATNFDLLEYIFNNSDMENKNELFKYLHELRREIKKVKPNKNIIYHSIEKIVIGASGNLVAVGIIEVIKGLISLI